VSASSYRGPDVQVGQGPAGSAPEAWPAGRPHPPLAGDAVHVWRALLDEAALPDAEASLSPDERSRAARLHFEQDRRHFITARALLRTLLGRYLGGAPEVLRFAYGPQGRPTLAEPADAGGLTFSVSHSQGVALYAFTRERAVGVDVERIRGDMNAEGVASQMFSTAERAALAALAPDARLRAFFDGWTRKEAYAKAIGEGLRQRFSEVEVSLAPGAPVRFVRLAGRAEEAAHWTLQALTPAPGYAGALAVRGLGLRVACFGWASEPGAAL
jgi:4'-phosphopantetheinyl transferase